ncbi:preprotein translocase subunit SecE [Lacipirellula sp.]|uniref:preprotein translocase subunit SecE n=1 Tax=Lacipirellula sp. TaxID=2691419 RepID=UPI003D0F60A1
MAELIAGIFTASRYKRNQGKVARQATFFALLAVAAVGAWTMSSGATPEFGAYFVPPALRDKIAPAVVARYVLPMIVLAIGAWAAFRVVNMPKFAEFLISVENEMGKVSWPSRGELFRASMVVLVVIFFMTAILLGYDLFLKWFIGVLLDVFGKIVNFF